MVYVIAYWNRSKHQVNRTKNSVTVKVWCDKNQCANYCARLKVKRRMFIYGLLPVGLNGRDGWKPQAPPHLWKKGRASTVIFKIYYLWKFYKYWINIFHSWIWNRSWKMSGVTLPPIPGAYNYAHTRSLPTGFEARSRPSSSGSQDSVFTNVPHVYYGKLNASDWYNILYVVSAETFLEISDLHMNGKR